MQIVQNPGDWNRAGQKTCIAIGVFDGVHLGHQHVIRQTVSDATQHEAAALVVTFDRHPNSVVAPDRVPPQIYSLSQKLRAIEALGGDAAWVIHFDQAFSKLTGAEFVRGLVRDFGPIYSVCVGSEFTFGHKRSGNVSLLQALGRDLHFTVHGLAAVSLDGLVVSSTRIREAVRAGQLEQAGEMLGRPYSVAALVIPGDQVARTFNFPTANLDIRGMVLPPNGVYAAHAWCEGKCWRSVVNLGFRPTRAETVPTLHLEAHLLDFTGDLYGKELELAFVEKLRDERKFPSLEALRHQIVQDITCARGVFPG